MNEWAFDTSKAIPTTKEDLEFYATEVFSAEHGTSFSFDLTPEMIEVFDEHGLFSHPNFCPACEYTHDSKLWVRKEDDLMHCDRCDYVLLEKDTFPPVISE